MNEAKTTAKVEEQDLKFKAVEHTMTQSSSAKAPDENENNVNEQQPIEKKDTVGYAQNKFIEDLKRAQQDKSMQDSINGLTQGQDIESLKNSFICKHLNRYHCVKFMCKSCYHQVGNSKVATCGHPDRSHYSQGKCKSCYHKLYYEKKKNIYK